MFSIADSRLLFWLEIQQSLFYSYLTPPFLYPRCYVILSPMVLFILILTEFNLSVTYYHVSDSSSLPPGISLSIFTISNSEYLTSYHNHFNLVTGSNSDLRFHHNPVPTLFPLVSFFLTSFLSCLLCFPWPANSAMPLLIP